MRIISYLAPSIPEETFVGLAELVGTQLGIEVDLAFDPTRSGPKPGEPEPFTSGEADVGFVCAPSYIWLSAPSPPPIELLGAAWVPDDPRAEGLPVYFSDVVTRVDSGLSGFAELEGRSFAFNDAASLSGYFSLRIRLAEAGKDKSFLGELRHSGSHLRSLQWVLNGEVVAAAVDSNVLGIDLRRHPERRDLLKVIDTWGPFPTQPIVVRRGFEAGLRSELRDILLAAHTTPIGAAALVAGGFSRMAPVTAGDYDEVRKALERA